jgi:hypothetical protein
MASRYPQWWRNEKHERALALRAAVERKRSERKHLWQGIYIGWSALGWIVILAHYIGVK